MKESPPLRVTRPELESATAYAASLFKGTLPAYPGAVLKIAGNSMTAGMVQDRLTRMYGLPPGKIQVVPDWRSQDDSVNIVIVYDATTGKRTVWMEFKLDLEGLPIRVSFEVTPDGAYVEEVGVQLSLLKAAIKKHAAAGRVQNIKIATKVEGLALFDRPTSDRVETALKAKIKAALSADVRFPGTQRTINIELYGSASAKFQDDKVKPIFEGGVMLTVPFDLL